MTALLFNKEIFSLIALQIKRLRSIKGFSQEVLAKNSHLPMTEIAGIEKGKRNPTICTMRSIAVALNCRVKSLFDFDLQLKYSNKNPRTIENSQTP